MIISHKDRQPVEMYLEGKGLKLVRVKAITGSSRDKERREKGEMGNREGKERSDE